MTALERLIIDWNADAAGRQKLKSYLTSKSGVLFLALLRELPRPNQAPFPQPGVNQQRVEAQLYRELIGFNRAIQMLEELPEGIENRTPGELTPWGHYTETEQHE